MGRDFLIKTWILILGLSVPFISWGNVEMDDFSDRFSLAFITQTQEYVLSFWQESLEGSQDSDGLEFMPNRHEMLGLQVSYLGFSFSLLDSRPISESNRARKGKTTYYDYRFNVLLGKQNRYLLTAISSRFTGLYLNGSHDLLPITGDDPHYQVPDLKVTGQLLALTYLFSPERFSLNHGVIRQKSRGGSWLLRAGIERTSIDNPGPIIPLQLQPPFGLDQEYTRGIYDTFWVLGGYGYNFVFYKKWLLSLMAGVGPGYQRGTYATQTLEHKFSQFIPKLYAAMALGYNGENFYGLLSSEQESTDLFANYFDLSSSFRSMKLALGYRF